MSELSLQPVHLIHFGYYLPDPAKSNLTTVRLQSKGAGRRRAPDGCRSAAALWTRPAGLPPLRLFATALRLALQMPVPALRSCAASALPAWVAPSRQLRLPSTCQFLNVPPSRVAARGDTRAPFCGTSLHAAPPPGLAGTGYSCYHPQRDVVVVPEELQFKEWAQRNKDLTVEDILKQKTKWAGRGRVAGLGGRAGRSWVGRGGGAG